MIPTEQAKPLPNSKTFNLIDLFKNNFFVIPDYQRGYSWEEENLNDLLSDIENISNVDGKHYTGTIVATEQNASSGTYELVDGQQRLTTLIILLNEIYHFDKDRFGEIYPLFISRGPIGNEKPVFTPNAETTQCFFDAVIDRKPFNPETKSHELILKARLHFENYLLKESSDAGLLYRTLVDKLNFLFFTPEPSREIGIMFEVINNRGKLLSELEKIKNFFIYYATVQDKIKLRQDINARWSSIQMNLSKANRTSNEDENAFLRYCFIVFFKTSKDKSWHVYEECKAIFEVKNTDPKYVDSAIDKMRNFVEFLSNSSTHYAWFFKSDHFQNTYHGQFKDSLSNVITYLRCQPTYASIMPLYLSITARMDKPEQVVKLLSLLEVVNMRLYVLPDIFRRADSKQADMFEFAWEFYNDRSWHSDLELGVTTYNNIEIVGDVFEWLYQNLIQITYAFCPYDRLIDNLELEDNETFNYYRWTGIRFFLACYEEHMRSTKAKRSFDFKRLLTGKKAVGQHLNDLLSIEHIWASKNMSLDFPEDFHTKRRLGNFVLCGLSSNITLSNNSIPDKIDMLLEQNGAGEGALDMLQVAELSKICKNVTEELGARKKTKKYWGEMAENICEIRENAFKKFAFERWKLPNEKAVKR